MRLSTKEAGLKLKRLREKRGLTLQELSRLSGASESAICAFENGKRKKAPDALTVFKLAKSLQVDFEYFFSDQNIETIVQKRFFFVHKKEMIIKIPVFSHLKKMVAFIKTKMSPEEFWSSDLVDDFVYLPAYLNLSFCFYMPDNSMAPMIMKNDRISIFKTHTLSQEVPCLFIKDDSLYLRKVQRDEQQTHLYPVNRKYKGITFDNHSSDWQIVGIALSLWREIRNAEGENILLQN